MAELAIRGGSPVAAGPWPTWPEHDEATVARLRRALQSGRWTISSGDGSRVPYEREFAVHWSKFVGVKHTVLVDHGTTALVAALEAVDVGFGDEVIVPSLTWVATASAVLAVNAIPKFVDVSLSTGCIEPGEVAAAITTRTKAIVAVHLHCRMADMSLLRKVAEPHGIPVIEDCAQAHGAIWDGQCAGSLGTLGCFSMQQSKVLTCGDGGAVVTSDDELYDRLQQLRADGRRYRSSADPAGHEPLVDGGIVMGSNYCLSEIQAALLCDQLDRFPAQATRREANAARLDDLLIDIPGLEPLERDSRLSTTSTYEYAVKRHPAAFAAKETGVVARAISAEIGFPVYMADAPLPQNELFRPHTKRRFAELAGSASGQTVPPNSKTLSENLLLFHHAQLLAEPERVDLIVEAFRKVALLADQLPA